MLPSLYFRHNQSEFYTELIDEVIIKTIQAIQDENSKLSEKELPKIKK